MTWILYKMTREATLTEAGSGSAVPGLGVGAGISTRGTKEPPVAVGRLHSWTVAWLHSSLSLLRSSWCTHERANFTALYTQSWLSDLAAAAAYLYNGEGNGTPLQYSCRKIPWTEEPGGLQSMRLLRVGHD